MSNREKSAKKPAVGTAEPKVAEAGASAREGHGASHESGRRRSRRRKSRRQLNVKLIMVSLVLAAAVSAGFWGANWFQRNRMADSLLGRATAALPDDWQQAQQLLREYLHFRPDDIEAAVQLADIQMEHVETNDDWYHAYRTNEDILRADPTRDEIRRRNVDVLLRMGRFADAREHLAVLLQQQPENGALHLLTAITYSAQKNYPDAAAAFGRALQDREFQSVDVVDRTWTRITAFAAWAELLREHMGQPGPADALYDRMAREHPKSAEALLARANYRRRHGLVGAAADARTAFELDPHSTPALVTAAELTLLDPRSTEAQIGSMRGALSEAVNSEAVKSDAASAGVYHILAAYERQQGNPAGAAEILERGVEQNAGAASLLFDLATELADRGKDAGEQLKSLLGQAASRGEDQAEYVEGCIRQQEGRYTAAIESFERTRKSSPDDSDRHLLASVQIAKCYVAMGRLDAAFREYERVLTAKPRSAGARLGMAAALMAAGRWQDARRTYLSVPILDDLAAMEFALVEFQLARAKTPESANWEPVEAALAQAEAAGADPIRLALLQARTLLARGDTAAAVQLLTKTQQAMPDRAEPRGALATLAIQAGDLETARTTLDEAATHVLPHPELDVAQLEYWRRTDPENFRNHLAEFEKREYPEQPDQWIQLQEVIALYYGSLGDKESRLRVFSNVASRHPDHVLRWFRLIEPSLELERSDLTDQALDQLRRLEGSNGVYVRLGTAQRLLKLAQRGDKSQIVEARSMLESFIKDSTMLGVNRTVIYAWLGQLDMLEGKRGLAADRFQLAAKEGSQDPRVWLTAAQLLIEQQRTPEALDLLKSMAGAAGSRAADGVALTTANLLYRLNQKEEALSLAAALVANDPKNSTSRVYLGMLHSAAGDRAPAEREFREAIKLAPEQPGGWVALVDLLVRQGDQPAAEKTVAEAEQSIRSEQSAPALAACYELVRRFDDAEKQLKSALAADPQNAVLVQQLAAFYLRTGRQQAAATAARGVLDHPEQFRGVDLIAARRLLAGGMATGSFADFQEAVRLLELNLQESQDPMADRRLLARLLLLHTHPDFIRKGLDHIAIVERAGSLTAAEQFLTASALDRLEEDQAADPHWQALLEEDRPQPQFIAGYLRRELDRGRWEGLDHWAQELESLQPEEFETVRLLSRIDVARSDVPAAAARLSAYSASAPDEAGKRARSSQAAGVLAELALSHQFDEPVRRQLREQADTAYQELNPANPDVAIARANLLGRTGNLSQALDELERIRPTGSEVAVAAAAVQLMQSCEHDETDVKRIKEWVDASRRADPNSLFAIHVEEALQRIRGEYDDAIRLNGLILKTVPENAVALNNLAWLLSTRKQQHAEALQLIQRAVDVVGPTAFLLDTRGLIQLEQGDAAAAAKDFRTSWIQDKLPATRFHLARALMAAGDRESARYYLAAAVDAGLTVRDLEQIEGALLRKLCADLGVSYN
ncbi:MAG: tetratricopeptide repeat protein [Planctomycetaceae bacterium]